MSEQNPVDRFGHCPNCNENWDGGEVYDSLANMGIHILKSQKDIEKLAAEYGWTPENKIHFSKTATIEVTLPLITQVFTQCPKCLHVYNSLTGEHYKSIALAKAGLFDEEKDEELV